MKLMNKLILSMDIYSADSIEETCNAYRNLARIRIKKRKECMELIFDRCRYDTDITIKEFENYLINAENIKK